MKLKIGLGIFLGLVLGGFIFNNWLYAASAQKTMTISTVTYEHKTAGTVYTLYDSEHDQKITTPYYELAKEPGADKSYLSTAITCSISKTTKEDNSYIATTDGKNRPQKIYQGMKATYKTDGAVFEISLENGDKYEACDVSRWNYNRLGQPRLEN